LRAFSTGKVMISTAFEACEPACTPLRSGPPSPPTIW
jgi:hypothetical protein